MQMQELFRGYYNLTEEDLKELWKNAVFVFDTNILLNLYRYQSSTRDSLIKVIEGFSERVWIPHYVGLEFQTNRLGVISSQYNRYSELEEIVSKSVSEMKTKVDNLQLKKKHSNIDPDKLIKNIEDFKNSMSKEIDGFKIESIDINSQDVIREKIDELFNGKIGKAPESQDEIDKITKEGAFRYKQMIPPGFQDNKKDLNENESSHNKHSDIYYERKYGDLIIWKQIIKYARENKLTDIVFITDDNKSDWWLKKSGKTIGSRPELTNEIIEESDIERFHMYTMESFLNYANDKMGAEVKEEVRSISLQNQSHIYDGEISVEDIAYEYLLGRFGNSVARSIDASFDYVTTRNGLRNGFKIKDLRSAKDIKSHITDTFNDLKNIIYSKDVVDKGYIIFVIKNEQYTEEIFWLLRHLSMQNNVIKLSAGSIEYNEFNKSGFLNMLGNYR